MTRPSGATSISMGGTAVAGSGALFTTPDSSEVVTSMVATPSPSIERTVHVCTWLMSICSGIWPNSSDDIWPSIVMWIAYVAVCPWVNESARGLAFADSPPCVDTSANAATPSASTATMDPAMSPVRRRRGAGCSGGAGIDHDGVSGSGDGTLGFVGVYWLIDSSSLASLVGVSLASLVGVHRWSHRAAAPSGPDRAPASVPTPPG